MDGISEKEFQARVERVRQKMAERQIDMLLVYSWKRGQSKYLAGYYPNYVANTAAIAIALSGPPILFIRFAFDLERAQSVSWIKDIRASGSNEKIAQDFCQCIRKSNLNVSRIGMVGGDRSMEEIPYSFVQIIKDSMPEVELVNAGGMVEELRLIKSEDEVNLVTQSAAIADEAIRFAREKVAAGNSELDIVAEAEMIIRRCGGTQHLVVIAAPGNRNLIRPASIRRIADGEDIILEAAVEANGYWSQIAATFSVGSQTGEQKKIVDAVRETYHRTIAAIKPGKTCAEIAQVSIDSLHSLGFGKHIEQDFGHGIGLDLPEPPKLEAEDHTMIQEGMVMVVHPAVRVRGVGSAFIGGTVYVNRNGADELHDIDGFYK